LWTFDEESDEGEFLKTGPDSYFCRHKWKLRETRKEIHEGSNNEPERGVPGGQVGEESGKLKEDGGEKEREKKRRIEHPGPGVMRPRREKLRNKANFWN